MPYGWEKMTASELYAQISKGTKAGDVFSVMTRRLAEREAISALFAHGRVELVFFGANDVQLRRVA